MAPGPLRRVRQGQHVLPLNSAAAQSPPVSAPPVVPAAASPIRTAWGQVILASVLMVATLPGRTQGLGLITEPLLGEVGLDRVTYANLNLWATLLGALFCFPAGWMLDRFGARWTSAAFCLLLAGVVWRVGAFAGSTTLLFLLLLATRALGQSGLSVASITVVGKAVPRRTGVAMGVFALLLSIWFMIAFGLIGSVVREQGWRTAWKGVAVGVATVAPLALLCSRSRSSASNASAHPAAAPGSVTLWAAVQSPAFWVFAGAGALFNLVSSGLGLFNEAVLAERGFDRGTFHTFLVVTTFLALAGQFLCGWLTTRWSLGRLTMVSLVLYAIGLAMLPFIRTKTQLWSAALPIGVAGGMIMVVFFAVWPVLFGPAQLGRIQGAAQICTVISSALGPVVFATCFKSTGSYAPVLAGLAVLVILNAVAAWRVALPRPSVDAL